MKTLCMAYKAINGLAPDYLKERFRRLSDKCKRELHNTKTDLEIPLYKSALGQKCFSNQDATVWNHLSLHTKLSPILKGFKEA